MRFLTLVFAFALTGVLAQTLPDLTTPENTNTKAVTDSPSDIPTSTKTSTGCAVFGESCGDGSKITCCASTSESSTETTEVACVRQNPFMDTNRRCGCIVKNENNTSCGGPGESLCCPDQPKVEEKPTTKDVSPKPTEDKKEGSGDENGEGEECKEKGSEDCEEDDGDDEDDKADEDDEDDGDDEDDEDDEDQDDDTDADYDEDDQEDGDQNKSGDDDDEDKDDTNDEDLDDEE